MVSCFSLNLTTLCSQGVTVTSVLLLVSPRDELKEESRINFALFYFPIGANLGGEDGEDR